MRPLAHRDSAPSLRDDIAAAVDEVDRLLDQVRHIEVAPSVAPAPVQAPVRRWPIPGARLWLAGIAAGVIAVPLWLVGLGQSGRGLATFATLLFIAGMIAIVAGLVRSLAWLISGR